MLCSLVPGPGPCPEPDESFTCHPVVFFNIIFNIILSLCRFSLQAVCPLCDQKPVCTCHFLRAFTCLTHLIFLDVTILLTLILPRSRTGKVWFYTSTSNKRAARPKLHTKSLTRDLKLMYSRPTLVRISINL